MPSVPPSPEPGPSNSKKANHNDDEKGIGHLVHYVSPFFRNNISYYRN